MTHPLIASLRGRLIVSVQAYPGEPMRHPETMAQIARAAEIGGAAAIRCQGLSDISAIKGRVQVPVIGLWKEGHDGVYITPSLRHARACVMAGADVVAIDATDRPRADGRDYAQTVAELKREGALVMADCGSMEDARRAVEAGSDIVSTTLAGYTGDRGKTEGPDLELLAGIVQEFPGVPVICEGRVHTPGDAAAAIGAGAFAVIVGTAITHPTSITGWFKAAVKGARACLRVRRKGAAAPPPLPAFVWAAAVARIRPSGAGSWSARAHNGIIPRCRVAFVRYVERVSPTGAQWIDWGALARRRGGPGSRCATARRCEGHPTTGKGGRDGGRLCGSRRPGEVAQRGRRGGRRIGAGARGRRGGVPAGRDGRQ